MNQKNNLKTIYFMPYIMNEVNEGIAKLVTLMVEGKIDQNYGVQMQYPHCIGIISLIVKHIFFSKNTYSMLNISCHTY
jgi:hypothetical protein